MRDFISLDPNTFCNELERISFRASSEWIQSTTSVMDNSNFPERFDYRFMLPSKLSSNISLAILSWYIGDFGFILREDIREKYEHDLEDNVVLTLLLESKEQCLLFLLDNSLWHSRNFFGNTMNEKLLKIILRRVRWVSKPKARKLQRKRGYHDKGSMTLNPRTAFSDMKFINLTREHYELESKRKDHSDSINLIQGWFT
jgi:hypothetical protein